MKKILILSCLFLFFVSSCSNQEEVIVGDGLDYDNMSEEDLRKCAELMVQLRGISLLNLWVNLWNQNNPH